MDEIGAEPKGAGSAPEIVRSDHWIQGQVAAGVGSIVDQEPAAAEFAVAKTGTNVVGIVAVEASTTVATSSGEQSWWEKMGRIRPRIQTKNSYWHDSNSKLCRPGQRV